MLPSLLFFQTNPQSLSLTLLTVGDYLKLQGGEGGSILPLLEKKDSFKHVLAGPMILKCRMTVVFCDLNIYFYFYMYKIFVESIWKKKILALQMRLHLCLKIHTLHPQASPESECTEVTLGDSSNGKKNLDVDGLLKNQI